MSHANWDPDESTFSVFNIEGSFGTAIVKDNSLFGFDVPKYVGKVVPGKIMNTPKSLMRTFLLKRTEDVSGVSGVGVIAEGIEFTDGTCVIKWLSHTSCVGIYPNIKELVLIHGHEGRTKVVYDDGQSYIL